LLLQTQVAQTKMVVTTTGKMVVITATKFLCNKNKIGFMPVVLLFLNMT